MEKVLKTHLGIQKLDPNILLVFEKIETGLEKFNTICEKYESWQLILITAFLTYILCSFWYFYLDLENGLIDYFKKKIFKLAKKFPFLNRKIMNEIEKTNKSLQNEIIKSNKGNLFVQKLPEIGMTQEKVLETIQNYTQLSTVPWKSGSCSGTIYAADKAVTDLTTKVYEKFAWSNPLHADVFPDVRKMEAEVVRMVCNMYNGDKDTCGTMTSGGTESIMLACRAYRDRAYSKGIKRPEMVIPITAHAAFDKAAQYFRIKINHVPVDPKTTKVDIRKLESFINSNTCMIVGSAPNFPTGAIDSFEDLNKIAIKYKVPLHVDACLGGFLIPFMADAGYKLPLFDFRLSGVTSISCDTHKYGFSPKGSSVVLYRNKELRKFQYFSAVEWTGGIYVSPTFAGSRPGSLIAMTWATLMYYGLNGYIDSTKKIIETTKYISNEIKSIKELRHCCEPDVSVIAFDSKDFNILNVLDELNSKGWLLNAIQMQNAAIHLTVTKLHTQPGIAEKFVKDLKDSVKTVMDKPDRKLGKTAAIYCSSQSIPDKSIITDVAFLYLDACYNTQDESSDSK